MKRFFKICSFIITLVILAHQFIPMAYASTEKSMETNPPLSEAALSYFDFYYDNKVNDTIFPDYYGGVSTNKDGSTIFYVTTLDLETVSTVKRICRYRAVSFQKVLCSFNKLREVQKEILKEYGEIEGVIGSSLDISENSVCIFVSSKFDDYSKLSESAKMFGCKVTIKLHDEAPEDEGTFNDRIGVRQDGTNEIKTATQFYSGLTSYRSSTLGGGIYSYTEAMGTISFVAVDSAGQKVIFTHGHNIYAYGGTLKVQNTLLSFTPFGNGNSFGYTNDASYAILPSDSVLWNAIRYPYSGYALSGTLTMTAFESISNPAVYYYGRTTSAVVGSGFSAYTAADGTKMLSTVVAPYCQDGDSGGPIFVNTVSGYYLVGIIKDSNQSSWSHGVYLTYIENLYYNETGNTISVFVSSTPYS